MSGPAKHHHASSAARIAALESQLAALTRQATAAETALANLRRAYTKSLEELQLMKRRLFVAKAERADGLAEQQLAFDTMFERVEQLAKQLDAATAHDDASDDDGKKKRPRKSTGRRDLADADLPEERMEILDPERETSAERIGFEVGYRLGYQRGGMRKLAIAVAVYKASDAATVPSDDNLSSEVTTDIEPTLAVRIVTTEAPKELFRRAMLAPSMIAHLLTTKYLLGVPFCRLEQSFALQGGRSIGARCAVTPKTLVRRSARSCSRCATKPSPPRSASRPTRPG